MNTTTAEFGTDPTDNVSDVAPELADKPLDRSTIEAWMLELPQQPSGWRQEANICCDFYDNHQLSQEDKETLEDRGQPEVITNLIQPTVDTVLGMEVKSRSDFRVRGEDDDVCTDDMAEGLSLLVKRDETESGLDRATSEAYAAQVKAGLGWVYIGRERDGLAQNAYMARYVHRSEIYWDWRSKEPDLSDARYLIRRRWILLDDAIGMFPMFAALLRQCGTNWQGYDPLLDDGQTGLIQHFNISRDTRLSEHMYVNRTDNSVLISEVWYRKAVQGYTLRLPTGAVVECDFDNAEHQRLIVEDGAQVKPAVFQKVRLAWYVGPHMLYDTPSPYNHRLFPYVPFFGKREDLSGAPYGIIRVMLSPQREVNARKSKMLWAMNSKRVIADADAVEDHEAAAAEVSRQDAYIILKKGRTPDSQFQVDSGADISSQQFQALQEAKQSIPEASGVHKALMGQNSSATSGFAINSLVEQGVNGLADLNDNYRIARRIAGQMLFEMRLQDMLGKETKVKIGQGAKAKPIVFNRRVVDPETGQTVTENDTTRVRPVLVLDDVPATPSFRMQQMQQMTEMVKSLPPQMQAAVADIIFEQTDSPRKYEIADRIRSVAGVKTPEQMDADQQAAQQAQQAQMAIQQQAAALGNAKTASDIKAKDADTEKTLMEVRKLGVELAAALQTIQAMTQGAGLQIPPVQTEPQPETIYAPHVLQNDLGSI